MFAKPVRNMIRLQNNGFDQKIYTTKSFSISSLWIFWRTFIYSRLWNHRKFSLVWSQGAALEQQFLLVLQQSSLPPWWVENFNLWVMWRHELSERQFLLGMNGTSKIDKFLEKRPTGPWAPPSPLICRFLVLDFLDICSKKTKFMTKI